jgi:hypothetical protein
MRKAITRIDTAKFDFVILYVITIKTKFNMLAATCEKITEREKTTNCDLNRRSKR